MNIQDLKARLLPPGQTIKVIRGKAYLYEQSGSLTRLIGAASEDQVRVFKHSPIIRWLVKNEKRFLECKTFLESDGLL